MYKKSFKKKEGYISKKKIKILFKEYAASISEDVKEILLLPPDNTRKPSGAGILTNILYQELKNKANITIMPATGTHDPMTTEKIIDMFGEDIPLDVFVEHKWRQDTVHVGTIPGNFVNEISKGVVEDSIDVAINKRLISNKYDRIISIGQVVPHEVVGMANYSKNIFVGCGGEDMINKSHFIGAAYGMERLIGKDHSPVRRLFDYAQDNFLEDIPLDYILMVSSSKINPKTGLTDLVGLFIGRGRGIFEEAVALSQQCNITKLSQSFRKIVVYLDPEEFKSLWVGCKGIYRTRLAVEDGGEIVLIAPGLSHVGEDEKFDRLMRKYGYLGKDKILELVKDKVELQQNLAVPAHLIHGSSNGRFSVTYASDVISKEEIEGVNFNYLTLEQAFDKYKPDHLSEGYNILENGEEIYYIENPAIGLWVAQDQF